MINYILRLRRQNATEVVEEILRSIGECINKLYSELFLDTASKSKESRPKGPGFQR